MNFSWLNKKKIIFIIIAIILLIWVVILISIIKDSGKTTKKWANGNLTIWIFWDKKEDFLNFSNDFKKDTWNKNLTINIESFNSWEDYNLALASAISAWKAPDIFVLNSWETSLFENQAVVLDPIKFNPDKFRNEYKAFIEDKLIIGTVIDEEKWKKQEFVMWIPVWYETLWIFYNRLKWIQPSDFDSWSSLYARIQKLKERRPDIVPFAIWRWSTVKYSSEIITQFFMLENASSLDEVTQAKAKSVLSTYFTRYAISESNWYDDIDNQLRKSWKNNLDAFSRWEVAMVAWFPRMLLEIDKKWFRKSALYARPFPAYFNGSGKSYINYNYFVLNKDSNNKIIAESFLSYLNSDAWALKYLKTFPYYLSARNALEEDIMENYILDWYKVKLKDFNNQNLEKATFDKKIKLIYDRKIKNILDNKIDYLDSFSNLKKVLSCKFKKIIKLENLSSDCEK